MKVTIRHLGGAKDGEVQEFADRDRLGIGSEGCCDADLKLPVPAGETAPEREDDELVSSIPPESDPSPADSGEFAEICFDGVCYELRKHGGGPQTRVNGQSVESVRLSNGDVIEFGSGGPKLEFSYELEVPDTMLVGQGVRRRWRDRFTRLRLVALGTAVFAIIAAFALNRRLGRHEAEVKDLLDERDRSFAATKSRVEEQSVRLDDSLAQIQDRFRQADDRTNRFLEVSLEAKEQVEQMRASILEESESMLKSRLDLLEQARLEDNEGDIETLRREIGGLRSELGRNEPVTRTFQRILEDNDSSVVLIYLEYGYEIASPSGSETRTSSSWGSGFFVTDEGHIVTNKHVVRPWLFDPQFAALAANGLAKVVEGSVKVAVWQGGSRAFDEGLAYDFSKGWNTHALKNLSLYRTAPDTLEEQEIVLGGGVTLKAPLHRHDNNDLAILKAEGHGFRSVASKIGTRFSEVQKLDPVMVIGFPRGRGILETRVAETSPSTGTVRKIEDTIYVTASIIPGNSGGPVFTADGEVIGVATRVFSETLGICLRIEHALELLRDDKDPSQSPPK